jgi:hypothetical protein
MSPDDGREISERDQLWASLRALQPEIGRLAEGDFDGSDRQQLLVQVLARVVNAELDFRSRSGDG